LGWILVITFFFKAIIAILINRSIFKFCFNQGYLLRTILFDSYQRMSYTDHTLRNSSEYIRNINIAVAFSHGMLEALLRIISEVIVVVFIVIFLAYQDIIVLGILLSLLASLFFFYDLFFKQKIKEYGVKSNHESKVIIKKINEGIEGFKDLRILGTQDSFKKGVKDAAKKFADLGVKSSVISSSPRYLIEFILVLFLVLVITLSSNMQTNLLELVPTLTMFAFASIRLAPSANLIVSGVSKLRFGRNSVSILYEDLKNLEILKRREFAETEEINDFKSIEIRDLSFGYPNSEIPTLKKISLSISAKQSIGFIGPSGSGKTTIINILAGLLRPSSGHISVNGNSFNLFENPTWMKLVAYLPQNVYTIDDTITNNIALGISPSEINFVKLKKSLKLARLDDLITSLPKGVDTQIGERGIRLSGGQKQRLALARAFYFEREILILDESTSSLDESIEREIVEEIKLLKDKTIIIIAHRLSTVKHCDKIYEIKSGKIVNSKN